jgi:hypothetical protein
MSDGVHQNLRRGSLEAQLNEGVSISAIVKSLSEQAHQTEARNFRLYKQGQRHAIRGSIDNGTLCGIWVD